MWLAVFFSMIPIGAATGYGVAGIFSEFTSWRFTFALEAIIMTPISLACWFMPHSEEVLYHVGRRPKQRDIPFDQEKLTFFQSLKMLFGNLRYDIIVLGYSAVVVSFFGFLFHPSLGIKMDLLYHSISLLIKQRILHRN